MFVFLLPANIHEGCLSVHPCGKYGNEYLIAVLLLSSIIAIYKWHYECILSYMCTLVLVQGTSRKKAKNHLNHLLHIGTPITLYDDA